MIYFVCLGICVVFCLIGVVVTVVVFFKHRILSLTLQDVLLRMTQSKYELVIRQLPEELIKLLADKNGIPEMSTFFAYTEDDISTIVDVVMSKKGKIPKGNIAAQAAAGAGAGAGAGVGDDYMCLDVLERLPDHVLQNMDKQPGQQQQETVEHQQQQQQPKPGGMRRRMVSPYDPNYQTIAGLLDSVIFGGPEPPPTKVEDMDKDKDKNKEGKTAESPKDMQVHVDLHRTQESASVVAKIPEKQKRKAPEVKKKEPIVNKQNKQPKKTSTTKDTPNTKEEKERKELKIEEKEWRSSSEASSPRPDKPIPHPTAVDMTKMTDSDVGSEEESSDN